MSQSLQFRIATNTDAENLHAIRVAAFAPIFASFQEILGETIYTLAQSYEDAAQAELLDAMLTPDSDWIVFVVESSGKTVGFVSLLLNREHQVGEIGLNAVHPDHAGAGIGTQMYEFALNEMKKRGMKVATVATGGDPSHQPALAAYRKAGFDVEIPSIWLCKEL